MNMITLSPNTNDTDYWQSLHPQPVAAWLTVLEAIRGCHALPAGEWQRFDLGRNIVFALGDRLVLKLIPPFWSMDAAREEAALRWVQGRFPIATPELIASSELDGWRYFVLTRLPGEVLRWLWPKLDLAERVKLAQQHGVLMAAIHNLPATEAPAALAFPWAQMIDEQWRACAAEMQNAGVPSALLANLSAFLAQVQPALASSTMPHVLLHGDLNYLNFMVERQNGNWHITGLIDWSDAKLGPVAHEFISPGVHMYRGEQATLHAWYAGYGLRRVQYTAEFEYHVTARAMLYYADMFNKILALVPGAAACQIWAEVARCLWHMNGRNA